MIPVLPTAESPSTSAISPRYGACGSPRAGCGRRPRRTRPRRPTTLPSWKRSSRSRTTEPDGGERHRRAHGSLRAPPVRRGEDLLGRQVRDVLDAVDGRERGAHPARGRHQADEEIRPGPAKPDRVEAALVELGGARLEDEHRARARRRRDRRRRAASPTPTASQRRSRSGSPKTLVGPARVGRGDDRPVDQRSGDERAVERRRSRGSDLPTRTGIEIGEELGLGLTP